MTPGGEILLERDVEVPLAPDVALRADVYRRPDGRRRPVLLQYTAYNKSNWASVNGVISPTRAVEGGFNVVVVDALGRFNSDGEEPYRPFVHDGPSAAACIEWAASQSWSNGSVGMYGASNNGVPQWQAARVGAPSLKTIVPHFTASEFDEGWVYQGGAFNLGFNLWWSLANLAPDMARRARERSDIPDDVVDSLPDVLREPGDLFDAVPLDACHPLTDIAPHYRDWIDNPPGEPYWRETSLKDGWASLSLPILHVAGWYNVHLDGNLANFVAMRHHAPPEARDQQFLIIGPWTQWMPALLGDSCGPERRFPAVFDMEGLQLDWFAHHLRDGPAPDIPRVRAFMMGSDTWLNLDDWPPPSAQETVLHLHSGGRANSLDGDGELGREPPGGEPADHFLHDPRSPVPTVGGSTYLPNAHANSGSRDQSTVERRRDVLVYSSEPLSEPVDVLGPVKVVLHVESSAESTDFTAKLVDVFPDGRAMLLCDGITRTGSADEGGKPVLRAGEATEIQIDLTATGNTFQPGHRIRLEVSSSNFPKFDRHGSGPGQASGPHDLAPCLQTVFHDSGRPSALILPTLGS